MGGATIQDNIYYGPNQWKGYEYEASPTIYKFIHHLQIIHGMETLIYTANSWKVDTVSCIPLSSTVTFYFT